jgi:adenosine deaminase
MYATYADHPIQLLYEYGLSLSVNTDTRMITPVTLTQEYEQLHQIFGWGKQQFLRCNLAAVRAAFLPQAKKDELEQRLQSAFAACE